MREFKFGISLLETLENTNKLSYKTLIKSLPLAILINKIRNKANIVVIKERTRRDGKTGKKNMLRFPIQASGILLDSHVIRKTVVVNNYEWLIYMLAKNENIYHSIYLSIIYNKFGSKNWKMHVTITHSFSKYTTMTHGKFLYLIGMIGTKNVMC